jgi:uncharacterized protein YceK
MRNCQKIFLLVSIVALLICSCISIFAALPSGDQTNGSSASVLYTESDCRLLMAGLLAQADLQFPFNAVLDCFILTVSKTDNTYTYYIYSNYPNRVTTLSPIFYKADNSSGVGYGGFIISQSGGIILSKRNVSVTADGGLGSKIEDFSLTKRIEGLGYGKQLPASEVVLAYMGTSGEVITFGSAGVYGDSSALMYQASASIMRDMAQSWINARDVKRDGLPAGGDGTCTISPEEESSIYQAGYNAGEIHGYIVGHQEGESQGKNIGYQDGYSKGYESGNEDGYNNGYKTGYDYASQKIGPEQYSIGHAEGYSQGHSEGFSEGYETGYRYGAINNPQGTPVTLNIPSIITSITSSVGSFLTSAFDIEIFGINVAGLLSVLILVAFVLIIVHVTKGGK